ncbi:MAG: PepSY-like domain-containing protein [Bacteroidota bacterium]
MKITCSSLIFVLLFGVALAQSQTRGQVIPPESVKISFDKHFPQAIKMNWKVWTRGYAVDFLVKDFKMEAVFSSSGVWQFTDVTLPPEHVPASVKEHVARQYQGAQVISRGYHDADRGSYYIIKVRYRGGLQKLLYDDNGKFLRAQR